MRTRTDRKNLPLNIYEVHAGSWKKKTDDADGWYNYMELARLLVNWFERLLAKRSKSVLTLLK